MPGIFERISTMLRANINAALDQAEDPEAALNQIIRDMAKAIEDARSQVAEMIAQERLLQGQLQENRRLIDEWNRKAELAVSRGLDDLAREALRRKLDFAKNTQLLETQWQSQHDLVEKLKHDLQTLQTRYQLAQDKRDQLIQRQKAAQAVQRITQSVNNISISDPSSELARLEDRIRLTEARAQAGAEMAQLREPDFDDAFAALEADGELEAELAALKAAKAPAGQLNAPETPEKS